MDPLYKSMIAMEEEEEVPVAKGWSIWRGPYWTRHYRMMPMEEEVTVVKRCINELRNLLMGRSWSWSWSWYWCRSRSTREFDKLEDRIWKLKTEYHQRKRTELDQVADIWNDIKRSKEEDHICTEKMQALMSLLRSTLGYFAGNGFHPTSPFDHTFRFYCSTLLREVAAYSDELLSKNGNPMAMDVPIDIDGLGANSFLRTTFGKNVSPSDTHISNNNMQTGKMGAETKQTPLLPQKDNRQRELEGLSTFAFLGLILSYAVLYFFYSVNLGRKSNDSRVMTGLHVWTVIMMLLMFISSCVRFPARLMIVLRLVMSGILFVSALVVFILLQLAL